MTDWRIATALRYVSAGPGDSMLSFMSFLSISGLVLGIAVLVIVLSVMNGFERELRERVLGVLPQGVIYSKSGFDDYPMMADKILQHPQVSGVAPFLEGSSLLVAGGKIRSVTFLAVDSTAETRVSIIDKHFIQGDLGSLKLGEFNIAMGLALAEQLSLSLGDKVTMVLPEARLTLAGIVPRTKRFTLRAIFDVGADIDKGQVFIHLQDGMTLLRSKRLYAIRIATADLFETPRILKELLSSLPADKLFANSWMRRHGSLYDAIRMQKSTMFLLLLMLVVVAACNLVSNLVMVVNQKKPDIAILRTMGASTSSIRLIFILYASLLGVIGILLGLALGVLVASYVTEVYGFVDSLLQLGLMDEYFIHYLPSEILLNDLISIGLVSLLICFLVTIYPASVAAAAHPVEALKYE